MEGVDAYFASRVPRERSGSQRQAVGRLVEEHAEFTRTAEALQRKSAAVAAAAGALNAALREMAAAVAAAATVGDGSEAESAVLTENADALNTLGGVMQVL